jgi:hypothetical protein
MKLANVIAIVAVGAAGAIVSSPAQAQAISPAKAAELTLHRIERLVLLKKIDSSFQTKFQALSVLAVADSPAGVDAVAFTTLSTQAPSADGQGSSLSLTLSAAGKPLDFTVTDHGVPVSPPVWADKDAVSLTEEGMHYLIDHVAVQPELKPYFDGFIDLVLSQTSAGAAQVEIRSSLVVPTLRLLIASDGSFQSATIQLPTLSKLEPTYASVKANILEPKCLSCHSAKGSAERVPLGTLSDLLNSPLEIVIPGSPDESGLVIMTSRTDAKRMPPPNKGPALTVNEISFLRSWIEQGAQP